MHLNSLKAHILTTFTFKMINDSSKSGKLLPTARTIGTVIEFLLMDRGDEVLVQGGELAKGAMAEIVFVGSILAVPCLLGGFIAD